MGETAVRTATSADHESAVNTIVLAFAADPMSRWCWPDSRQYLTSMPSFTLAFGGGAFGHDSAHCTEDCAGVALWLPPDVHPDEETLGGIVERTVSGSTRGDLLAVMEQMAKYHPAEPHWYLPLIGVDPAHQGEGYGGALLTHALQRCDRDQTPAYLESANPRNVTLYLRHGFKAIGRIQVGSSPPMVPMVRDPR
jgi:GNAT superfamily N-acetyltransferase